MLEKWIASQVMWEKREVTQWVTTLEGSLFILSQWMPWRFAFQPQKPPQPPDLSKNTITIRQIWAGHTVPSGVHPGREGGCSTPPHSSKFRRPSKIMPNWTRLWKMLKIAEFRTPKPQDVRKQVSKILKLPSFRNCFTLAMTNKLIVRHK